MKLTTLVLLSSGGLVMAGTAMDSEREKANQRMTCDALSRGEDVTELPYQTDFFGNAEDTFPEAYNLDALDDECRILFGIQVTQACAAQSIRDAVANHRYDISTSLTTDARFTKQPCKQTPPSAPVLLRVEARRVSD